MGNAGRRDVRDRTLGLGRPEIEKGKSEPVFARANRGYLPKNANASTGIGSHVRENAMEVVECNRESSDRAWLPG